MDDFGVEFEVAKKNVVAAATDLSSQVEKLETAQLPYYLAGHSLGAAVLLEMLRGKKPSGEHCRGVFLLGAAADASSRLKTGFLPRRARILNYFSPKCDEVLNNAYFNKTGHAAGGAVGFEDGARFLNYACAATHSRKGVLVHSDWSQMAKPLIELAAFSEGLELSGGLRPNLRLTVLGGRDWWNNVMELSRFEWNGREFDVRVQHHKFRGGYRLIMAPPGTDRYKREAWSERLGPILRHLDLSPKHPRWPLFGYAAAA